MRELLHFLVEQKLSGTQRDTQEYAVGIEVFKRDPATYNTCTDPIVRVQVGRLRERLRDYYAEEGGADPIRFVIPIGAYMPEIVPVSNSALPPVAAPIALVTPSNAPGLGGALRLVPPRPRLRPALLAFAAVAYFDNDPAGAAFVRGLDEELVHQLYRGFGATIVPYTRSGGSGGGAGAGPLGGASHRLEGSVRIDAGMVRLSLRVLDSGSGSVVWSQQFDQQGALSIPLQDRLAAVACAALARYFAQG
jgi:TolB-like protein